MCGECARVDALNVSTPAAERAFVIEISQAVVGQLLGRHDVFEGYRRTGSLKSGRRGVDFMPSLGELRQRPGA